MKFSLSLLVVFVGAVAAWPQMKQAVQQTPRNAELEQCINEGIKQQFISQSGSNPPMWELDSYAAVESDPTCVFAKVQCGPNDYVHLRIRLPGTLEGFQGGKSSQNSLEYFDAGVRSMGNMGAGTNQRPAMPYSAANQMAASSNWNQQQQPPMMQGQVGNRMGNPPSWNQQQPSSMSVRIMNENGQRSPDEVKQIFMSAIKQQYVQKVGSAPAMWELVEFARVQGTQIVIGKLKTGEEYVHVRIQLPGTLEGFQQGKSLADPILYFESEMAGQQQQQPQQAMKPNFQIQGQTGNRMEAQGNWNQQQQQPPMMQGQVGNQMGNPANWNQQQQPPMQDAVDNRMGAAANWNQQQQQPPMMQGQVGNRMGNPPNWNQQPPSSMSVRIMNENGQRTPDEVKQIFMSTIKQQYVQKVGSAPAMWELVEFARVQGTQIVIGKLKTGEEYVHVRIQLPGTLEGFQQGKSLADPILYFESEMAGQQQQQPQQAMKPNFQIQGQTGNRMEAQGNWNQQQQQPPMMQGQVGNQMGNPANWNQQQQPPMQDAVDNRMGAAANWNQQQQQPPMMQGQVGNRMGNPPNWNQQPPSSMSVRIMNENGQRTPDEVKQIFMSTIKQQYVQKVGSAPAMWELVEFARVQDTQIVIGKLKTGEGYVHVRIQLPGTLEGFQQGKSLADPILYFEPEMAGQQQQQQQPMVPNRNNLAPTGPRGPVAAGATGPKKPSQAQQNFQLGPEEQITEEMVKNVGQMLREQFEQMYPNVPTDMFLLTGLREVVNGNPPMAFGRFQVGLNKYVMLKMKMVGSEHVIVDAILDVGANDPIECF